MGRGAWPATVHGVVQELDMTEQQTTTSTKSFLMYALHLLKHSVLMQPQEDAQ